MSKQFELPKGSEDIIYRHPTHEGVFIVSDRYQPTLSKYRVGTLPYILDLPRTVHGEATLTLEELKIATKEKNELLDEQIQEATELMNEISLNPITVNSGKSEIESKENEGEDLPF